MPRLPRGTVTFLFSDIQEFQPVYGTVALAAVCKK
jgi:hypothetical protein